MNKKKEQERDCISVSACVGACLSVRLSRPGRERGITGFLHVSRERELRKQPTESSRTKKRNQTRRQEGVLLEHTIG